MRVAALVLTALPGAPAGAVWAAPAPVAASGALAASAVASAVIPVPAHIVPGVGAFNIGPDTVVRVPRGDRDADSAARYLIHLWARTNGLSLPLTADAGTGADAGVRVGVTSTNTSADSITFRRQSGFAPEAYRIEVMPHEITVSATTAAGLFYGAVTLWQLLPPRQDAHAIPAQTIRDAPRYPWRGLMLDSVRHFQSAAFVRSMIDWMAWHKLNVLHWHLTDDQGWRLEIRRYPRLTSVGAWRTPARALTTESNASSPATVPAAAVGTNTAGALRYGGFYTQEEVRGIVAFAATRHVQIVPEIEMPGHAQAAIAAYPELGVRPAGGAADVAKLAVSAKWGVHTHLFNLKPSTFDFLENVLAEVMELFPSPVIHVGGDEAVKDEWNASREVQARARQLGIHDADALQAYFTQRIGRYLAAHGRRLVGWDEILRPGLARDAIVMSWHGVAGAHAAAMAGNDTVLAPSPTLYFDNRQSTLRTEPPGRLTVVSLEDVYRFDPSDATLSEAQQRHVLGVQANLWTEHMQTEGRVQWMALPRAAAVAELGWSSPESRSWPDFLERLVPLFARYRAFELNYADSVFAVGAQMSRSAGKVTLTLSNQAQVRHAGLGAIHYTLDGREPTAASAAYAAPLAEPLGITVRAATFVGAEQASRTWTGTLDEHAGVRRDSHDLELCSNAIGLLLEPDAGQPGASDGEAAAGTAPSPLAVDIMNPCWIDRGVDLTRGPRIVAAVAPLPFNYEIGADAAKIRVGDARTPDGEFEVHIDGCDAPASVLLPLTTAARVGVTTLPAGQLPRRAGRHDLCLRFARPRLNPMWALDWVEIGE